MYQSVEIMEALVPILGVTLSLGFPLLVIIGIIVSKVKKSNNNREIRRLIIENHTDLETAKHLIEEPERTEGTNPYPALRWGCVLIGLGIGALAAYLLSLQPEGEQKIYFWVMLAFGCGLGLLCSFVIEYKLQRCNAEHEAETTDS